MINRSHNRAHIPSFIPKYSDPDILKAVVNSDIWKHLFLGEKKAVWLLFKALFFLKLEMFISPVKAVLRYNHGNRTIGVFITLMSALMMIAFNTQYIVGYFATFFPLAAPVIPFFMSDNEIFTAIFLSIKSTTLLLFWMIYVLLSGIHLIRMYRGWGNPETSFMRGHSIMHGLIFKHFRLSETLIKHYIEPLIIGGVGYYLLSMNIDFTFGLFLMIAAGCLFFQETYDAVLKFSMKR